MKKLLLLLFAFGATFASCDKDEKFEGEPSAFIGTTWEAIDEYDIENEGVTIKCKDVSTLKFQKDNKVELHYVSFENEKQTDVSSVNGTYRVDGTKISITAMSDETDKEETTTGVIDGTKITFSDDEDSLVFNKK